MQLLRKYLLVVFSDVRGLKFCLRMRADVLIREKNNQNLERVHPESCAAIELQSLVATKMKMLASMEITTNLHIKTQSKQKA